ncbi:sensor histidine kinase [Roseiconus lacunae]|uniref:histidine kinase n=1 Tax=Roseiconus lacunae TaxID=2605694 RepID=A0ABT7PMD4_9BACT|nr:HAMP domain-containing sensor histidine kinase [Roseiconus lacunae]MCD0461591.1 HAMP domain-containing histidine kinase [Roseiconus lacunae]MDM4017668.1 HAMP domain-containing sensor histidine kinase [Roseiconus lacunae]WRQ51070.1 HAMP domain-containing sensor histidine kinase [Stieleria sp. HD01]
MRLAAKLILLFLCGLFLIVGVFAFATVRREKQATIEQHQRYATELAEMLKQQQEQSRQQSRESPERSDIITNPNRQTSYPPLATTTQRLIQIRRVELASDERSRQPHAPIDQIFYSQRVTTVTVSEPEGVDRLYTYVPVDPESSASGERPDEKAEREHFEVSAPDVDSENRVRRALSDTLLTLLSVAGLSALVVYFGGVRMVGRPLQRLIDRVNRIAEGDLSERIEIHSHDELADLAVAINAMCDRLNRQRDKIESETAARLAAVDQLRHADRLRSVGRIAAGVAHEIGTPLNVVAGHAELIEAGELSGEAIRSSCRQIRTQCDRITKTISSLLAFARNGSSSRQKADLSQIIEDTCQLLQPIARKTNSTIETSFSGDDLSAEVDSGQMQQVLTNLISNALQSSQNAVRVHVSATSPQESSEVLIVVADDGDGISAEHLNQLFDPFFTTKDIGEGTGLGLSIVHGIVHEHGGRIEVSSQPGSGAAFTVHLPKQSNNEEGANDQG